MVNFLAEARVNLFISTKALLFLLLSISKNNQKSERFTRILVQCCSNVVDFSREFLLRNVIFELQRSLKTITTSKSKDVEVELVGHCNDLKRWLEEVLEVIGILLQSRSVCLFRRLYYAVCSYSSSSLH
jgi:hypothetical protein